MVYNINIVNLFQPFLSLPPNTTPYLPRARSVTSAALASLRRLLTLQESRHGWSNTITLVLHALSITSFGTLDEIAQSYHPPSSAKGSDMHLGVLVCLRALAALCSYNFYAQPLFRLLAQKCTDIDLDLAPEVQATADYYLSDEWTRIAKGLVSSQYIADIRERATDREKARMDAIIAKWEGLSIEDRGKGKGQSVLLGLVESPRSSEGGDVQ